MRRRTFIASLGATAIIAPAIVCAQSTLRRRVGVLSNEPWRPLDGLRDGLKDLGYTEGQNIDFLVRYAAGDVERFTTFASQLVRVPVDLIVAWGTPASLAAKAVTQSTPIIMISGDPIAVGLVPGLAYPGGNVTGLSTLAAELESKRIELMRELLPRLARIVVLSNPTNPYCSVAVESARRGAVALGVQIDVINIAAVTDLDKAFLKLRNLRPDGVLVVADPFLASQQTRISSFLVEAGLPSIYTYGESVRSGGLMSYATNYYQLFRQAAVLADKILRGTKPSNLPVEQPTHFELTVNLKTAKALGLTVPPTLISRADEVIE
jgi:putative tryptophan/tyrosine transport system substrate-binding protein